MTEEVQECTVYAEINGTNYVIDKYEGILINAEDETITFKIDVTPYCLKCNDLMEFYHTIDEKYDRYSCPNPCREDRWVLKEFTPRTIDAEVINPDYEYIDPVEMINRLEGMGSCIAHSTWDPFDLRLFLEFITASELHYFYFVKVLVMYKNDSDVFVSGSCIHNIAMNRYQPYKDRSDYQGNHHIDQKYVFNSKHYPRPPRPIMPPHQVDNYIESLFSSM